MKDNTKDLIAIIACILTAYFVASAATVEGATLYGVPVILFCAVVSFVVHWVVAIPSLLTSSEKYFDFTGMIATLLIVATAILAIFSLGQQHLSAQLSWLFLYQFGHLDLELFSIKE